MIDKLELLRRKQLGKLKLNAYKNLFTKQGFKNLELIDLEKSEVILVKIKTIFSNLQNENEMISEESISFIESDLIREIYLKLNDASLSYVFTDDFETCGIFLVKAKQAIEQVLYIAKKDVGHTCFILDFNFSYYLRVNYFDKTHNDNPYMYDIQRILKK